MKRFKHYDDTFDNKKQKHHRARGEQKAGGFRCAHCKTWIGIHPFMGTANRNHCNICLWSKHVDMKKGDRLATCRGGMKPIGLTFKHEGFGRVGEIMLVHQCCLCGKISINRLAGDDSNQQVLQVFATSLACPPTCLPGHITPLTRADKPELQRQLFGANGEPGVPRQ